MSKAFTGVVEKARKTLTTIRNKHLNRAELDKTTPLNEVGNQHRIVRVTESSAWRR